MLVTNHTDRHTETQADTQCGIIPTSDLSNTVYGNTQVCEYVCDVITMACNQVFHH